MAVSSASVLLAACGGGDDASGVGREPTASTSSEQVAEGAAPASAELVSIDRLREMRAEFARIDMAPDVAFLTEEEREVVNLLVDAASLMSEIYLWQLSPMNPATRDEISMIGGERGKLGLDLFDLHFGPWDSLDGDAPFYGDSERPDGAGFYPPDMTKEAFEAWIADHPGDAEAFRSGYTVIRHEEGGGLVARPYSEVYAEWLEPAAAKLREAAAITSNESLRKFLNLRADAFMSDDYYESELAWMDLDGPIEVAIGPYEVYDDRLFGYKTAFEAFITLRDPAESAALEKYKGLLKDMEANLPVDERYKNFKRGFESPIAVVTQVHGGGDNVPGVQTIAFNLPNDERVREAKGAKKVILSNVLGAKFERILSPMAEKVLVPAQAGLVMRDYMSAGTLFHELSHSLGPGTIVKNGRETTVAAELQELYSRTEEGKADVMGAYNILFMMDRGELPAAERENFLATYFVGLIRSVRFGIEEAHGAGAAFQYAYFREKGAFSVDEGSGLLRLDFERLEQAIMELTRDIVVLQGDGDYDAANAFLETYARLDQDANRIIATLTDLPVDIQPVYPARF
ncbi:MAG: hypothetical protein GC152_08310 [Alphaproteobacteria bacterium]|nr:hypothetical protein [Alphaproteobacteria bacterium]